MASTLSTSEDVQGVMNVTKEDQQMINRFARLKARHEDIKDEIQAKASNLKNIDDAIQDAEMKVLEDEADNLHLQVGDIMVNLSPEKIQDWLNEKSEEIKTKIEELTKTRDELMAEMQDLKVNLYAKFGNNIHLESTP